MSSPPVWVLTIVGQFQEPFLEAAMRSVGWADGFAVVNTDPENGPGQQNERIVRNVVPREKLRLEHLRMGTFDFAKARNKALELIPEGAWVLIVDADDVHWDVFEGICREAIQKPGTYACHFWHLCLFKDLWHSQPHRKILFQRTPGVRWVNTMGAVHEELLGVPEPYEVIPDYRYWHGGYLKSPREVSRRWEFYRSLGAAIHDYDRTQPDRALDDWPRVCQIFTGEHPPAVREVLKGYPASPPDIFKGRDPRVSPGPTDQHPRVGLVMLTWDDAENLKRCLATLSRTVEPFDLMVVDNGSTDATLDLLHTAQKEWTTPRYTDVRCRADLSLAQALNVGFDAMVNTARRPYDYIGWIHPDHSFEWWNWLTELRQAMDDHPEFAKLGATEAGHPQELRAGNSQCYLVRRTALETVGLFDEEFIDCGGWEDWDHNRRLLEVGEVMIWPDALVRHEAMSTRARHDNVEAAKRNGGYYTEKWGDSDPPV